MTDNSSHPSAPPAGSDQRVHLKRVIDQAGDLLPVSGPITAFVFLNNLQALEDLPFEEGVTKGAKLFGCNPYLPEDRYRDRMAQGRIRLEDIEGRY